MYTYNIQSFNEHTKIIKYILYNKGNKHDTVFKYYTKDSKKIKNRLYEP